MHEKHLVKMVMSRLKQKYKEKSVRLQPHYNNPLSGVYDVHVRPLHAEKVEDLDWKLVESGQLDLIAKNNGVFRVENRT